MRHKKNLNKKENEEEINSNYRKLSQNNKRAYKSNLNTKYKNKYNSKMFWTQIEDSKLLDGISKLDFSWMLIEKNIKDRSRIQIRNRFTHTIDKFKNDNQFGLINLFIHNPDNYKFGTNII